MLRRRPRNWETLQSKKPHRAGTWDENSIPRIFKYQHPEWAGLWLLGLKQMVPLLLLLIPLNNHDSECHWLENSTEHLRALINFREMLTFRPKKTLDSVPVKLFRVRLCIPELSLRIRLDPCSRCERTAECTLNASQLHDKQSNLLVLFMLMPWYFSYLWYLITFAPDSDVMFRCWRLRRLL